MKSLASQKEKTNIVLLTLIPSNGKLAPTEGLEEIVKITVLMRRKAAFITTQFKMTMKIN